MSRWRRDTRRWARLAVWVALPCVAIVGLIRPAPDATAHVIGGLPRVTAGEWPLLRVLAYPGHAIGYSERRGAPLWVAYRSGHVADPTGPPRPDGFTRDWRVFHQPAPTALSGTGYTRGHLAPNYAISRLHGRAAQLATFHMTNIVAKRAAVNAGVWQRLEELETDVWAASTDALWIVTGPVFDAQREWTDSGVEIADAFYRVLLAGDDDGAWRALTFLVPHNAAANAPLDRFTVSIDHVERVTGLDLFAALDDAIETPLEAATTPDPAWRLEQVADRPGRYAWRSGGQSGPD